MTRYGRAHIKVSAILLGVVAMAGCASSAKPAASTATTIPRGSTSSTTRRRHPGSTTTTPTPTTGASTVTNPVVPGASAAAVSATFVSANHGYALAADGHIDQTTDGGHTWHRTGSVPSPQSTIRFIDGADGFAFTAKRGPLYITHDSGATWTVTPTPFDNVYDLAIARGVIDVAAFQQSPKPVFRIWTSPVAHLVWKAAAPTLTVGAGPIPSQQIVLNGGRGWILGVNRLVTSGARLNASNAWTAWTPPCLHEFGPAYLSASTGSDLVASCDEGVWGGNFKGITHTVWFSHDGGATFSRHTAPEFGPVLMANPQTAVVAGPGGGIQRTVDGGASWHLVLPFDATGGIRDSGFTTPTQGFIILGGGEMVMTHDAGASWQPVTLP